MTDEDFYLKLNELNIKISLPNWQTLIKLRYKSKILGFYSVNNSNLIYCYLTDQGVSRENFLKIFKMQAFI